MESNYKCLQCSKSIPVDRLMGQSVVCECGWSGTKKDLESKPTNPMFKKGLWLFAILFVAYAGYDGYSWGGHYPQKLMYSIFSTFKMTSPKHDAEFAELAHKLGKTKIASKIYGHAYKRAPENHKIGSAFANSLVETGQFETATMVFQNVMAQGKTTSEDYRIYAKALAGANTEGAKDFFYKALKTEATNFTAAKELIQFLASEKNYIEAISVLGHYNTNYPRTLSGWEKMAAKLKRDYATYNSEFKIEEMKISGLSTYLHAPVQFSEDTETQVFLVDNESDWSSVDAKFLDSRGISYKKLGPTELTTKSGQTVKVEKVLLDSLDVGPFTLSRVNVMACDNCAFLLGRSLLKRLNYKEEVTEGVRFATLNK